MAIVNHPPTTAVDTQNMTGELMPPSEGWRNFFQQVYAVCNSVSTWGASILRPNAFLFPGRFFFDTSLGSDGEPIWRNKDNTGWVGLAGGGGGTGTVTSVALGAPDIFTVSGSPVTTSGTLAFTPTDPNADRIVFWDDSAAKWAYLEAGSGLNITGTVLTATGGGTGTVTNVAFSSVNDDTATVSGSPVTTTGTLTLTAVDAGVDKLVGWDDSAGKKIYFTLGTGLSTTGTTLNVTAGGSGTVTDIALAVVNDDTVTVSGSPVTTTGTLTETAVDAGADKLVFWDDSAGKKTYATIGSGLVMSGTTLSATGGGGTAVRWPHFQWNGTPPSLTCLLRAAFPTDVSFLDDFAGSVGFALNPATADTLFDVQKNGSSVGTIKWFAFASVPIFISSGPMTFLGGGDPDVLEIYAPTIPDGTLGDFTVTLAGAP